MNDLVSSFFLGAFFFHKKRGETVEDNEKKDSDVQGPAKSKAHPAFNEITFF